MTISKTSPWFDKIYDFWFISTSAETHPSLAKLFSKTILDISPQSIYLSEAVRGSLAYYNSWFDRYLITLHNELEKIHYRRQP